MLLESGLGRSSVKVIRSSLYVDTKAIAVEAVVAARHIATAKATVLQKLLLQLGHFLGPSVVIPRKLVATGRLMEEQASSL